MITPKESAEQLVKRFHPMTYTAVHAQDTTGEYADAIRCALIAVDEIICSSPSLPILGDGGYLYEDIELSKNYWLEVKTELEKL